MIYNFTPGLWKLTQKLFMYETKREKTMKEIKDNRDLGELINALVDKVGNPLAIEIYESFSDRFKERHKKDRDKDYFKYLEHKRACFSNYIRAYYRVGEVRK